MADQERETPASGPLLAISDLKVGFHTRGGDVHAVNGINLEIRPRETVAIVGESGCGKSLTALSIMGLLGPGTDAPDAFVRGSMMLTTDDGPGQQLVGMRVREYDRIRGPILSMVFQEPMSALNPLLTVGDQVAEMLVKHEGMSRRKAWAQAERLFERVGIPEPRRRLKAYPFELSGGQKQRVMIAIAMSCNPKLLIADEPTTALDVTIQSQILFLLREIKDAFATSVLFITHNLGIVAQFADRVAVMYRGVIVECASVQEVFASPKHPYTRMLLDSHPKEALRARAGDRLEAIPGTVPSITTDISGCVFQARCPHALPQCSTLTPPERVDESGHLARCHLEEVPDAGR